jgi:hypothetical protein
MAIGFDPETEISYFLTTAIDFVEPLNGHEMSFGFRLSTQTGLKKLFGTVQKPGSSGDLIED